MTISRRKGQGHTSIVPACVGSIVATVTPTFIPEPSIAPAAAAKGEAIITGSDVFGSVGLGLFTFLADFLDVGEKFD